MSERMTREEAREKIHAVAISGDAYHADEILDTLDALRVRVEQAERARGGGLSGGRGATSIVGGR